MGKKEKDERFRKFGTVSFTGTTRVNDFIDHLEQGRVTGTGGHEVSLTFLRRKLQRRAEQILNSLPSLHLHIDTGSLRSGLTPGDIPGKSRLVCCYVDRCLVSLS